MENKVEPNPRVRVEVRERKTESMMNGFLSFMKSSTFVHSMHIMKFDERQLVFSLLTSIICLSSRSFETPSMHSMAPSIDVYSFISPFGIKKSRKCTLRRAITRWEFCPVMISRVLINFLRAPSKTAFVRIDARPGQPPPEYPSWLAGPTKCCSLKIKLSVMIETVNAHAFPRLLILTICGLILNNVRGVNESRTRRRSVAC
jgi:hypothetical protein